MASLWENKLETFDGGKLNENFCQDPLATGSKLKGTGGVAAKQAGDKSGNKYSPSAKAQIKEMPPASGASGRSTGTTTTTTHADAGPPAYKRKSIIEERRPTYEQMSIDERRESERAVTQAGVESRRKDEEMREMTASSVRDLERQVGGMQASYTKQQVEFAKQQADFCKQMEAVQETIAALKTGLKM
jgi:hypothetical protein